MNKFIIVGVLILTLVVASVGAVNAQMNNIMPTLYDASGDPVNTNGSYLNAGWYYLQAGQQVYYYGNGTYYDPSTNTYGGNVSNPNGTAGMVLFDNSSGGTVVTPGVPNTGLGGSSNVTWAILAGSALAVLLGLSYATSRKTA